VWEAAAQDEEVRDVLLVVVVTVRGLGGDEWVERCLEGREEGRGVGRGGL